MAYQNPFTAISLIPHSDTVQDAEGNDLYRISSQDMTLLMGDHPVADVIVRDFQHRSNAILLAAENALAAASADHSGQSSEGLYFCDVNYAPSRLDQMAVSVVGTETFYDGTQRSGQNMFSLNYDMHTGSFLALKDILTPDFSADNLVQKILEALADQADFLYEDYADTVAALFSTNAPVENWHFTQAGLCFYFNPYEIAPQSMGAVLAQIPYSKLPGLLQDTYFPAESVEFQGDITMMAFDGQHPASITQFAEAVLDADGEPFLIIPQGTVLNVRVETGTWTKSGAFTPNATVFFAEALTEGNALLLQLPKESLGSLCITYQTGPEIRKTPWQS